ncbi:hypothetical protein D3C87_720530 [compost metagenome]
MLFFFLSSFIDDFGDFSADPGEWEKDEEDRYFVEHGMIRINDNIQHRNEQHNEAYQNSVGNFCIFDNYRRYNATKRNTQSAEKQKRNEKGIFVLNRPKQGFPMLKRRKLLVRDPRGINLYPQRDNESSDHQAS